jgi:protein-L-isoaspartate O-methyltransferase
MRARSPIPELLDEVVAAGRKNLGFFPAHNNRAIEYPWLLNELRKVPVPKTVLDVGAGLNPIPFCLAEMGCKVTTIDAHPMVRALEGRPGWNEWGFLDYSIIDARITSVHSRYEEFEPSSKFDTIYSASVIEHLPAVIRRMWARRFSEQLAPGGRLLLTLDLIPNSTGLWNLSEEKQVDDPAEHGSQEDLCDELREAGFTIEQNEYCREVKDSRIDTGLVAAVKG